MKLLQGPLSKNFCGRHADRDLLLAGIILRFSFESFTAAILKCYFNAILMKAGMGSREGFSEEMSP